jgi:hypothetical protein
VRYPRDSLVGGIQFRLEVTEDLGADPWSTNGVSDVLIDTESGVELREGQVPMSVLQRRYLRLAIEQVDP